MYILSSPTDSLFLRLGLTDQNSDPSSAVAHNQQQQQVLQQLSPPPPEPQPRQLLPPPSELLPPLKLQQPQQVLGQAPDLHSMDNVVVKDGPGRQPVLKVDASPTAYGIASASLNSIAGRLNQIVSVVSSRRGIF